MTTAYSAKPECHPLDAATDLLRTGEPTLQSLEAGLIALAHGLGREHAMRVRRAMNCVLLQSTAPTTNPLPLEASRLGHSLDSDSLEQADAA